MTRYVYDAFDQRTAKQLDIGNNGVDRIEAYTWADGQEVLRWVDSDGVGAGAMRLANRYMWGRSVDELLSDEQYANNGFAVGSPIALATAGNTLWALSDHLGSVRDVVDNNGVVRQHLGFKSGYSDSCCYPIRFDLKTSLVLRQARWWVASARCDSLVDWASPNQDPTSKCEA